ncbi:hypothetical protein BDV98DRAFT_656017 [Pterulicium gracile]|uniref:Uncharacterized protein n=1 Tax=Pterulicium gracile TaxID=1884261 RepID=A0A5C3QTW7_9AGAR|nr:hypothetical protein BDV98DRAFT_656017 [Pterula gracilis]
MAEELALDLLHLGFCPRALQQQRDHSQSSRLLYPESDTARAHHRHVKPHSHKRVPIFVLTSLAQLVWASLKRIYKISQYQTEDRTDRESSEHREGALCHTVSSPLRDLVSVQLIDDRLTHTFEDFGRKGLARWYRVVVLNPPCTQSQRDHMVFIIPGIISAKPPAACRSWIKAWCARIEMPVEDQNAESKRLQSCYKLQASASVADDLDLVLHDLKIPNLEDSETWNGPHDIERLAGLGIAKMKEMESHELVESSLPDSTPDVYDKILSTTCIRTPCEAVTSAQESGISVEEFQAMVGALATDDQNQGTRKAADGATAASITSSLPVPLHDRLGMGTLAHLIASSVVRRGNIALKGAHFWGRLLRRIVYSSPRSSGQRRCRSPNGSCQTPPLAAVCPSSSSFKPTALDGLSDPSTSLESSNPIVMSFVAVSGPASLCKAATNSPLVQSINTIASSFASLSGPASYSSRDRKQGRSKPSTLENLSRAFEFTSSRSLLATTSRSTSEAGPSSDFGLLSSAYDVTMLREAESTRITPVEDQAAILTSSATPSSSFAVSSPSSAGAPTAPPTVDSSSSIDSSTAHPQPQRPHPQHPTSHRPGTLEVRALLLGLALVKLPTSAPLTRAEVVERYPSVKATYTQVNPVALVDPLSIW